ncbi:MAG TPA: phosphate acyltransferase PlsX [Trueperaceae bacterium]|nr:phosphate acyltransferase PlsX [Trueperaceae bacterium]
MNRIAIDAMGGDNMPAAAIDGAIRAAKEGIKVVLVGREELLQNELAKRNASLDIYNATDVIDMKDNAANVRRRKESSVMKAAELVKLENAAAFVSMGHSGATMAAALLVLGRIKGIERPAILANIPSKSAYWALIDAGANADCKAKYLQQFALMGSVYARAFFNKSNPKVGLLSIGEEEGKGNELIKESYQVLKNTKAINFFGNIEGRDLFNDVVDVVVTDGFTGNIVLKQAEGEAMSLVSWIKDALLNNGPLVKLGAALVKLALRKVAERLDPSEYGAQPLLGVRGYAFIGHGSSDDIAVYNALKTAQRMVDAKLVEKITEGIAQI